MANGLEGYTCPAPLQDPSPEGPEAVVGKLGALPTSDLSHIAGTPFQPLPKPPGSEQGAPWKTSSAKDTWLICV